MIQLRMRDNVRIY